MFAARSLTRVDYDRLDNDTFAEHHGERGTWFLAKFLLKKKGVFKSREIFQKFKSRPFKNLLQLSFREFEMNREKEKVLIHSEKERGGKFECALRKYRRVGTTGHSTFTMNIKLLRQGKIVKTLFTNGLRFQ